MKNDGIRATGALIQQPEGLTYQEMKDPLERAMMVAHLIRIGQRPSVGQEVGFSVRPSEAELDDFDVSKMTPVGEKVWYRISVTQADIDLAHALINDQRATYKEAGGGKVSQILTGE